MVESTLRGGDRMPRDLQMMQASEAIAAPERIYTPSEMERIRQPLQAHSMDEKWLSWTDAEDRIHLHRSWTGHEIYSAQFEPTTGGWRISVSMASGICPGADSGSARWWPSELPGDGQ